MGFSGWGRRCELVIQSSQVAQDCTDFPVFVHQDNLPSEIFDADGLYPALNGGGDLRFSSDQAGDSRLPCEVEQFITDNDPANGKSAVWVKRTLSSASNTSIWVYYNNPGEVQPSETDAYGKHAVWDSNYKMVQHMNQDPSGSAPQMIDSTSNSNDGTSSGAMTSADLVNGQVGDCLDFDNIDDLIQFGNVSLVSSFTISLWFKWAGDSVTNFLLDNGLSTNGGFQFLTLSTNAIRCRIDDSGANGGVFDTATIINDSQLHHLVLIANKSANAEMYLDGVQDGASLDISGYGDISGTSNLRLGEITSGTKRFWDGLVDEIRLANIIRSANWIFTEYNNQNSPATFIIEGTPESPPITIPSAPLNVQASDGTYTDKVRITWSASSGATSYEVYRSCTENSFKILLDSPSETTFDDETAIISVIYYYWVKAVNAAGSSDYSSYNTGWRATGVITWPTTLPAPQKKLSIILGDTRIERKLQSGRTEFRRFGDGKPDQMKVLVRLLWAQWDIFRQFYEYDLSLGCNWFSASWLLGLGYNDHKAKFLGYPREVARQGYYIDIICTLMIQKSEWAYTDITWPMGAAPIPPPPPPPTYSGYIYGGYGSSTLQDCDCLYGGAWTSKTNMPAPARRGHAASTISNKGYVYAGEGLSDCDEYTPTPDTWVSKTNVSGYHKQIYPSGCTIENTGYVFNGGKYSTSGSYNATCDKYDPDTWTFLGNFSNRNARSAACVIDGNAYIFGGADQRYGEVRNRHGCNKYNPSTNSYTNQTNMPFYRKQVVAFTLNDKGYMCAGVGGVSALSTTVLNECNEYDATLDTWTNKTNIPNPARHSHSASIIENKGYLYGGYFSNALQDCDEYNATLNSWLSKVDIPNPARYYLAASTI